MATGQGYVCSECDHKFNAVTGRLMSGYVIERCWDCGRRNPDPSPPPPYGSRLREIMVAVELAKDLTDDEVEALKEISEARPKVEVPRCECGGIYSVLVPPRCPECRGVAEVDPFGGRRISFD